MKLKDFVGRIVENKNNKQLNVSIKKNALKKNGISPKRLLDMDIDIKSLMEDY